MAEEIQKFDPSTLMQGVKDRIKATFVSLIPDEQWDQMVKNEIDDFFRNREEYYSRVNTSTFKQCVHECLSLYVKDKAREILSSPDFSVNWNPDKQNYELSAMMRDELVNKAPEIFAAFLQNGIAHTIQQLRQQTH